MCPPHRLMKNAGQQGILKGFLIKAFNVARFLMLIFHWFASIRQKGRKRVYRKRRPISQSLHRAGLAVPTVFLMSPAGFSKSFQREITHPLLFRDASLPALSMHCFLFHCLKLDSDHPCFLFQLVFPALWHLFGFHLFFSFSFTKKSKIPSQMSPKSLCVFAQNTWRSLRTTNYQQEQLNSFQNSLLSWRLCLPFILSAFKPILLKYLALPWAPFVCSCCLLHSGEPSISIWNKAASVQNQKPPHHSWWQENAVGIVICTQAFIPLRVPLFEMNEADKSAGFKSNYPPLGFSCWKSWAAQLLESKENKRQIWGRLQVSYTRDAHLASARLCGQTSAFTSYSWVCKVNVKEAVYFLPVIMNKKYINFLHQKPHPEVWQAPLFPGAP